MSRWKIWQRGSERADTGVPEILAPLQPTPPRRRVAEAIPATSQGPRGAPVTDRSQVFDPALARGDWGRVEGKGDLQVARSCG